MRDRVRVPNATEANPHRRSGQSCVRGSTTWSLNALPKRVDRLFGWSATVGSRARSGYLPVRMFGRDTKVLSLTVVALRNHVASFAKAAKCGYRPVSICFVSSINAASGNSSNTTSTIGNATGIFGGNMASSGYSTISWDTGEKNRNKTGNNNGTGERNVKKRRAGGNR